MSLPLRCSRLVRKLKDGAAGHVRTRPQPSPMRFHMERQVDSPFQAARLLQDAGRAVVEVAPGGGICQRRHKTAPGVSPSYVCVIDVNTR